MDDEYIKLIDESKVYEAAIRTPLTYAKTLSLELTNDIFIKREDLQPVFSFKLRGAYNKMMSLGTDEQAQGVIAASAGNHAQGVALSGQLMGIKTTIIMPITTPSIKVNAVKNYGAEVVLHGESYNDAATHAEQLRRETGKTLIHPYDDKYVIAGQGTIGKEIIEQSMSEFGEEPYAIFICIGGGGLAAGVASYVRQKYPVTKLIGVQSSESDAMYQSIKANRKIVLESVGIFADGVAVKEIGDETYRLCKKYLDEVITVTTDELCAAIKDAFQDTRSILEPAGALGIAGAKQYLRKNKLKNKKVVAIGSGANMNFDRLRHVSERTEFAERREAILAIKVPEEPGVIQTFCRLIGERGITEFNYRFRDRASATLYVGLSIEGQHDLDQVMKSLELQGYQAVDLTDNDLAKLHVRYMIGGSSGSSNNSSFITERLFRFRFPERPGALLDFLSQAPDLWNISLFHYRNHGSDFGRVLCAFEIPNGREGEFEKFLSEIGSRYWFVEETDNQAFRLFLQ